MKKRLERDQERAVVAGVLSGMARYYNQDPVVFRIAAITFLLLTGVFPGLLVYIVAWFIIPKNDTTKVDYEVVE
jgi:phage shock protein PspC (stress-responsive transcriptional regulator)